MKGLAIVPATSQEFNWAACVMVGSDPWAELGITIEQCLKTFENPEYQVFVASIEGVKAGFVVTHPRGLASSPYIKTICVDLAFRNQGLGEEMIRFVENHFAPVSNHLFLCVSSFNSRAQNLYLRLGYKKIGELEDYIVQGASEIIMHKWIK